MINTSSEYKSRIRKNRIFLPKASITLADLTELNLSKEDIMQGSPRIDDSVCDKIAIGTAVINKCTLTLNNFSGKFNSYDFTDAVIRPYSGLQLSETVEYLAKGVFTTDRPGAKGSIIVLEALDNMAKLNKEFSGVAITFPCTSQQLLQAVCLYCGVSIATVSFLNDDYIIAGRPTDEVASCREIIAWIAQIAGCFARCNTQGALELKWFDYEVFEGNNLDGGTFDSSNPYSSGDTADGGNFTDYTGGDSVDGGTFTDMDRYHHIYSFNGDPTIGTDDIVITGVQVTDSAETPTTVLYGITGYILPIAGNPLIQNSTQANLIASTVGAKIVGMRVRPFSGSAQSDPSMEAGDVAYISDRKGNSYPTLLTTISYEIGNYESVSCGTETPAKKSYRPTPEMKAIIEARKVAKQEISSYDLIVQQFTNLMSSGFGLYRSEELQENGSIIYYMHDKPTIAESDAVWKFGENGLLLSTDHGTSWGVDTNGNMLVNVLTAIGINAEWIKVITSFTVGPNFSVNALGEMMAKKGTIGRFILDETGLKSNAMQLIDSDVNPLIWLNSADHSEHANYEGSLTYLINSNAPNRQTTLLDSRLGHTLGLEFTKETISTNEDIQGTVNESVKYTADGIRKTSTNEFSNYLMNILGNVIVFNSDGIFIQSANGGVIDMAYADGTVRINGVVH